MSCPIKVVITKEASKIFIDASRLGCERSIKKRRVISKSLREEALFIC
jgi:hypothetical protein